MYNPIEISKFHHMIFLVNPIKVLLANEMGAVGVVVVNNRVSIGSVVKMNLGELTHRIHLKNQSPLNPCQRKIWPQFETLNKVTSMLVTDVGDEIHGMSATTLRCW